MWLLLVEAPEASSLVPPQEDQRTKQGCSAPSQLLGPSPAVTSFPLLRRIPPRGWKEIGMRSELVRGHLYLNSHPVSPLHPCCLEEETEAKKETGPELGFGFPNSILELFPTHHVALNHPDHLQLLLHCMTSSILEIFEEMSKSSGLWLPL